MRRVDSEAGSAIAVGLLREIDLYDSGAVVVVAVAVGMRAESKCVYKLLDREWSGSGQPQPGFCISRVSLFPAPARTGPSTIGLARLLPLNLLTTMASSSNKPFTLRKVQDTVLGCFSVLPKSETFEHLLRLLGTYGGSELRLSHCFMISRC